ncbi:hypothetical protein EV193_10154 [Herbihabitans rhizosphaerae]|uniref:FHA domain-containing protein n=1 Tax=Herbihabitans rhizosphaerae TaxID=1872711 RepID=A0A4Q7L3L0_9PSEU|nr:FHA domain-containing protein [Herbihabitans rhizosphaerae]RZS44179.1 hypothetical protein EV193_10154 [Herbihabitans rhizosphaerae]
MTRLARGHSSLALGVPPSAPRTMYALALSGGIAAPPSEARTVRFGRNKPQVDVCIGEDDRKVSRQQGVLTHRSGRWWLRNTGLLPLRLPGSLWLSSDHDEVPLAEGYTPVFVHGSRDREHLLELYVAGSDESGRPVPWHAAMTEPPRTHRLSGDERMALVVMGQRYLYHEAYPQPLSRRAVADQLNELTRSEVWTARKVEHLIAGVRMRLSDKGVHGLLREEVGEPVGNTLNDNLFKELIRSTTLVPPDLALLDFDGPPV